MIKKPLKGFDDVHLRDISIILTSAAIKRNTKSFPEAVRIYGAENVDILHPNYRIPNSDLSAQPKISGSQRRVRFAVDSEYEEKKDPDNSPHLTETSKLVPVGKEAGISADSSK